jgi:23S rRNA (cytosine1962-C5)-methyltransferase
MDVPAPAQFRDPALADFGVDAAGAGRRLERLGGVLVDRPLPQTTVRRALPHLWRDASAVFTGTGTAGVGDGRWELPGTLPEPWRVSVPVGSAMLSLEVKPAASGQIGVFLEQVEQWQWLARHTPADSSILSLFAHSGAATLALATAGAEVVHIDASKPSVELARRNAAASGLAAAAIRWICEDAATFVKRQLKRDASFSGAVLDPPSWGHGPKGQAFAIDRDLVPLLADVATLMARHVAGPRGPLLLTCHSPGWHPRRLHDTLKAACHDAGLDDGSFESGPLTCTDDSGRTLELGSFARWTPTR